MRVIETFRSRVAAFMVLAVSITCSVSAAQPAVHDVARDAQTRVVKVYGAGGLSGLESYQSGFFVSPEGHIATAWSYVLDVDPVVVLDDGRRFEADIVGFEPSLELAVLKIEASGLPFFRVEENSATWGAPVLAVSNLFGIAAGNEPASVMQGSVAAVTKLDARSGTFETPYDGRVLILDLIANNPGAAGGAVVDAEGTLVGMLGKELRDSETGVWLNYALPSAVLRKPIGDIVAGRQSEPDEELTPELARERAHSLETLGLQMVPDVLEKTPAYVDAVADRTAAARANLQPDDLVLIVEGRRVDDQRTLKRVLRQMDRRDPVQLTIQRGNQILPVTLRP